MTARSNAEISKTRRFKQILAVLHKYKAIEHMTPVKLRLILEELGPTFVKLGQIMSSRQDLIPAEYARELEKLRSQAAPMDYETVRRQFKTSTGKYPEDVFISFSKEPIGSASMAQVHEAVTHEGQKVVVKIQRPGIYEQMQVDVELMRKAGRLLSLNSVISSVVDIPTVINEFWTSARQEMDFRQEAANAERFSKENSSYTYIHVPRIYDEFTTRDVLVMEDIGGIDLENQKELIEAGYSLKEIAMKLGVNFMDQVVQRGFFHADPHSGNIKIQNGQVVWLDFGMMGELTASEAALMNEALSAMASKDYMKLTDCVLGIGIPPRNLDYSGFYSAVEQFMSRYISVSFSDLDLAKMVTDIVEVCHEYGIMLPKGITMLARSMVTIQGTLKDLDPDVNILKYVAEEKTSLDDINWAKEIEHLALNLNASGQAMLNIPLEANNVLRQMQKGQFKMNMGLSDLPNMIPTLNRMVDRIVVCLLIASLLVGSSIVCTTEMKPEFLGIPLLGFLGFFISFCLSVWLFYKMLFRRKRDNELF